MLPAVALAAAMLGALAPGGAVGQAPDDEGRVVIAVMPYGIPVEEIGRIDGIAPGVISAGLGGVPPAQSFLDIGQGNRVNQGLYETALPLPIYVRDGRLRGGLWEELRSRADGAPANIVPGLLGSTLAAAGVERASSAPDGLAPLIVADREGEIPVRSEARCGFGCPEGVTVVRADSRLLRDLASSLGPEDLLIAFAAGSRSEQQLWPVGILGEGFDGTLTSDSTRTDGVVLTTDLAPTVLEWLGVDVPAEMNGSRIRAEGESDPEEVAELQARLADRPSRETVALLPLGLWLLLATIGATFGFGRVGFRLFGLACAWAPFLLLVAAAADASEPQAGVLMAVGAVALAAATDRLVPGFRALALACAVTVGAHAADVIAGSPYTALSVLGPNPGGGVRFFGIGNELEAILTTLTLVGAGAWLASRRPRPTPRAAAGWFLALAAAATLAFAPGRFGADVGAAIVLGVGGATAAVLALGIERRRAIALVAGGGALALAALLVADLVFGGAHLSRTVLGAGGTGDLVDVFDRRISLMVNTFVHPVYPHLLVVTGLLLAVGFARRHVVLAWFGDSWPARYGYLGALAGVLVGTVANDSGSVLLVIGTIYLAASAAYYWGSRVATRKGDRASGASPTVNPS